MLRKSFNASAAAAAIALSLTACGGGGGGTSALPSTGAPTTTTPTQSQSAKATMTIKIPAKTLASSSKAQYISASTQSMTIGLVGSDNKTTQLAEVDLTPSSKNCSALAGGGLQCNVVFVGQAGSNTYVLSMYDKAGGSGNLLSTGHVPATLTAGQNTNIPVALDGVPVSVTVALGASSLPVGQAGATTVVVEARDSDHNIIVGPGAFTTPVTLAISGDANNTLSFATTESGANTKPQNGTKVTVNSPGQLVTLNYTGGSNVGSTITPSIGSTPGTAVTFAGSGGSMAMFQYYDATNGIYMWPYVALGLPTTPATGAVVAELEENGSGGFGCCPYGIAIVSPTTGVQKIFVGDTQDIYNPPASAPTYPGVTVVHGMTQSVETDTFESYDSIASDSTGNFIYYGGQTSTSSDPGCAGPEYTGVIGVLDVAHGTTKEYKLKGTPGSVKVDSSGNVWWIEYPGQCWIGGSWSYLIGGTTTEAYAIGELKANSTTPIETTFTSAGILDHKYPGGMSISKDGSTMFITDYSGNVVTNVATSGGAPVATAVIDLSSAGSRKPMGIATSSDDGTTLWGSNNDPNEAYFYGWVPKATTSFGQSALREASFPVTYAESYTVSYGDGSFWLAGNNDYNYDSGIGRVTVSGAAPQTSWYHQPGYDPEVNSVSAVNGYVWATDYDYYNIDVLQYGAQNSGTVTYARTRQAQALSTYPRAPQSPQAMRSHMVHPAARHQR